MNNAERRHEPTEERNREHPTSGWAGLLVALAFPLMRGLFTLEPNQAVVLVYFGESAGTESPAQPVIQLSESRPHA